jgi:hypothetical protein
MESNQLNGSLILSRTKQLREAAAQREIYIDSILETCLKLSYDLANEKKLVQKLTHELEAYRTRFGRLEGIPEA